MSTQRRLVLGISGGIAAYKTPHLIRLLRKEGIEVKAVLTRGAKDLVGIEALRTLSGYPVFTDDTPSSYDMDHIRLAQWGEVMLVCPATANSIAKIAHGIADNLLSTLALSFEKRIILAPAMNSAMWSNSATQQNLTLLTQRGVCVLPVEEGPLACGTDGPGRMISPEAITAAVLDFFQPPLLKGKRVLISNGPTFEAIDAVRFIGNHSSGKMGNALGAVARDMGAEVTMVCGPVSAKPPSGINLISVTSATDMLDAMTRYMVECDICILAAAVSDFKPAAIVDGKIDRRKEGSLHLELVANPDIAATLGSNKGTTFLVGFALEEKAGAERALAKMQSKKCDMMVLNYLGSSMGLDETTISIINKNGTCQEFPAMPKTNAAREILSSIARQMESPRG